MGDRIKYVLVSLFIFFIIGPVSYHINLRTFETLKHLLLLSWFIFFLHMILTVLFILSFILLPLFIILYFHYRKIKFMRIKNLYFRYSLLSFVSNIVLFIIFEIIIFLGCVGKDPMCGFPLGPLYLVSLPFLIIFYIVFSIIFVYKNKQRNKINKGILIGILIGFIMGSVIAIIPKIDSAIRGVEWLFISINLIIFVIVGGLIGSLIYRRLSKK